MKGDALQSRALFEAWLDAHREAMAPLALAGEPIDRRRFLGRVSRLAGQQRDDDYVFVLVERRPNEETPAYIGRASRPVDHWMPHLTGLAGGTGRYARWRTRLLREGHDTARFDLELLVVGQTHLQFPPRPGGATTASSVEEQLLGLAADAYPLRLLNQEGLGH